MKKLVIGLVIVLLFAIVAIAYAQGPGWWGMGPRWGMGPGMMGGQGGWFCPYCGQYIGPRGGYGMGPGMMGGNGGYGMGPGMMGGYGGYGMGPGMMGPGYGTGPGYGQSEECQKFLDETTGLRKELYNKNFEYSEVVRNPKTTPETAANLEKEVRELQEKINSKAPRGYYCPW
jgi:hypothetical protein